MAGHGRFPDTPRRRRTPRAWRSLLDGRAQFHGVTIDDATAGRVWHWLLDPEHVLEGGLVHDSEGRALGLAHLRAFYDPHTSGPTDFIPNQCEPGPA